MNFLTTIRGRVILLVLLLLVPASLLIFLTARDSRELQLSQARNQLLAVAWHANSALASDIRDLQLTTEMLNYVSAVRDATEPECSRVLAALLENKRYLGGVVLDENGNSRCNGIDGNKNPKNYADRDYFPKTMQSGVSVVAKPIIGRLSGRMVLPVTAPVKNADGKTVGLVVTALDLAQFGARFVQEQQVPGSVFLIWDRDGDLLYRYPDAEKLSGQRFPELQLVKAASAQGGKGTLELAGFDGLPRVFGFAALEEYKDAGVYVGVGVPAKELYASANALVWNALWATLVMGLIGVGAAWIIGRTMIWQPIKKLSNATTRMAAGDFSARLGAPYGRSELGELAQVFDQMAQASERGRNAMQDINNTLEQRVIERTAGLEASEQKFRNVLESAADAIVIVDRQGTVVIANASAETLFGYTRAELLGHSVDRLLPASFQVAHRRQREAYADSPEGRSMGERGAVKGLRKDATEFIASISLSPVQTPEGLWITAVVRDISDFIAAEVELKRLNRTLRVLSQCNHVLVGATDESELLDAICRMVVEIGGYRLAWVGFALHDEGATVLPVAQFGAHEGYVENLHITYADTERGRCPSGIAIREAHTVIAHSMQTSSYFIPGRDLALARGFSSCVALPLRGRDGVLGALHLYAAEEDAFSPKEVKLLEELAEDLGYGINSLRESARRVGAERQLDYQANFDGVTGLANRALLIDRLGQSLVHAQRNGHQVAVVLLDLDRFKAVNESFGRAHGDLLLKAMGQRLVAVLRAGDTVARLSADEFGVLMTDLATADDAALLTHKLLQAIAQPILVDQSEVFMTGSAGISLFPKDGECAQDLLAHANAAMTSAKSLGGNTFHFYSPEMNQHVAKRLALDGALRRSLERGELQVHYQPVVDLMSGEVVSAEALVRWPHPEMGMVSPVDFIPLAEETGLIVPLGTWVLNATCQQMRLWLDAGLPVRPVAVNLSARQFRQDNLVQVVRDALQASRLEPNMLALEITESTVMVDVDKAVATLRQLKALGVKLSLDDFGTGYSSLSYLKRFPTDRLKIDRSFVRDIISNADDAAICKAVIGLAHLMKMKVVAEGVETEGQMNYLRQQSCDEMQGYYFSRPLPPADFAQLLADGKTLDVTGVLPPTEN